MDERTTVTDVVYDRMRKMIISGELKPGTQLVRRRLAKQFGTSSIPVLESIRRLERDGLVVSQPKWGARVQACTLRDLEAVYVMREGLEGMACRLFAEEASPADMLTLVDLGRRFDECARALDIEASDEAEIALHLHIVKSAGSDFLYRFAENTCLIALSFKNTFLELRTPETCAEDIGCHEELIAALGSRDPEVAERAGRAHVRGGFQTLIRRLEAAGIMQ